MNSTECSWFELGMDDKKSAIHCFGISACSYVDPVFFNIKLHQQLLRADRFTMLVSLIRDACQKPELHHGERP